MDLNNVQDQLSKKFVKVTKEARKSFADYLEKKYVGSQDDSDIVDLRTLSVVHNKGSLVKLKRRNFFGSLTPYSCREGRRTVRLLKRVVKIKKNYRITCEGNIVTETKIEEIQALSYGYEKNMDSSLSESLYNAMENIKFQTESSSLKKSHTIHGAKFIPGLDLTSDEDKTDDSKRTRYNLRKRPRTNKMSSRMKCASLRDVYSLRCRHPLNFDNVREKLHNVPKDTEMCLEKGPRDEVISPSDQQLSVKKGSLRKSRLRKNQSLLNLPICDLSSSRMKENVVEQSRSLSKEQTYKISSREKHLSLAEFYSHHNECSSKHILRERTVNKYQKTTSLQTLPRKERLTLQTSLSFDALKVSLTDLTMDSVSKPQSRMNPFVKLFQLPDSRCMKSSCRILDGSSNQVQTCPKTYATDLKLKGCVCAETGEMYKSFNRARSEYSWRPNQNKRDIFEISCFSKNQVNAHAQSEATRLPGRSVDKFAIQEDKKFFANSRQTHSFLSEEIAMTSKYSAGDTTDFHCHQIIASAKEQSIQLQNGQYTDSTPVRIWGSKIQPLPCPMKPKKFRWDKFLNQ